MPPDRLGPRAAPTQASVLGSMAMIFALKTALAVYGYARVIRWVRRRVESVPMVAVVDPACLKAGEYAVAMAAALYPGRALCLEQSLVLYYLMRRRGVGVTFCHGVIPRPFQAHVWIEYRGEVLNDVPEHAQQYVRLPRQLP
jgi:Transglutaminase-like superfamily